MEYHSEMEELALIAIRRVSGVECYWNIWRRAEQSSDGRANGCEHQSECEQAIGHRLEGKAFGEEVEVEAKGGRRARASASASALHLVQLIWTERRLRIRRRGGLVTIAGGWRDSPSSWGPVPKYGSTACVAPEHISSSSISAFVARFCNAASSDGSGSFSNTPPRGSNSRRTRFFTNGALACKQRCSDLGYKKCCSQCSSTVQYSYMCNKQRELSREETWAAELMNASFCEETSLDWRQLCTSSSSSSVLVGAAAPFSSGVFSNTPPRGSNSSATGVGLLASD